MKDVCLTCLTTEQNKVTGSCINGHDNWFDNRDFEIVSQVSEQLKIVGISFDELLIIATSKKLK